MDSDRGVLTLAYGKQRYVRHAKALAHSLNVHSPGVPRAIVTDSKDPELHRLFHTVIPHRPEYGTNVRQKLYLDHYTPFSQTLFIDSDSFVIRDVREVFDAFSGRPFCIAGEQVLRIGDPDWFMDTAAVLNRFGLTQVPKFNGGVYWFDRSASSEAIFQAARSLLADYKALGFMDFRSDGPGDEPLYAVAMAIHGLEGYDDGGRVMRTPIGMQGKLHLNVFRGICQFYKDGATVSPAILHYCQPWDAHPAILHEATRLAWASSDSSLKRFVAPYIPALGATMSELLISGWRAFRKARAWVRNTRGSRQYI